MHRWPLDPRTSQQWDDTALLMLFCDCVDTNASSGIHQERYRAYNIKSTKADR